MYIIIIANIVSFIGSVLMVLTGVIKDKKKMVVVQGIQFAIMGVSNFMLGAYTGMVSNLFGIARNSFSLKWKMTTPWKIIFTVSQGVFTFFTNTRGVLGWFPLGSTALFTIFMDQENPVYLKFGLMAGAVLWLVFDISVLNFSCAAFDIFTIVSSLLGIYLILKDKRKSYH